MPNDQIAEYRREEAAHREYMKTHNAELSGPRPLAAEGPRSNDVLGGREEA